MKFPPHGSSIPQFFARLDSSINLTSSSRKGHQTRKDGNTKLFSSFRLQYLGNGNRLLLPKLLLTNTDVNSKTECVHLNLANVARKKYIKKKKLKQTNASAHLFQYRCKICEGSLERMTTEERICDR